jgi:hypothetical protein
MIGRIRAVSAAAGAVAFLAGCASPQAGMANTIPENLRVATDQALSLEAQATGVQIYECAPGKTEPATFAWTFKAPEADLFDRAGTKIGKHYAGPTWEANDGSKAVGEVQGKDDGPDAGAIPWLLLRAKSTSGNGVFSDVRSIQRLRTAGGKAPADGCGPQQAGKVARVPYTALYAFYVARSQPYYR